MPRPQAPPTGRDFRLVRQVRGLTLREVAPAVGLQQDYLAKLERGEKPLTSALEIKLCRFFWPDERPTS
jgi:transcriptional regulator with XRE-family HTH domain